jgi:hypothetical protein
VRGWRTKLQPGGANNVPSSSARSSLGSSVYQLPAWLARLTAYAGTPAREAGAADISWHTTARHCTNLNALPHPERQIYGSPCDRAYVRNSSESCHPKLPFWRTNFRIAGCMSPDRNAADHKHTPPPPAKGALQAAQQAQQRQNELARAGCL